MKIETSLLKKKDMSEVAAENQSEECRIPIRTQISD